MIRSFYFLSIMLIAFRLSAQTTVIKEKVHSQTGRFISNVSGVVNDAARGCYTARRTLLPPSISKLLGGKIDGLQMRLSNNIGMPNVSIHTQTLTALDQNENIRVGGWHCQAGIDPSKAAKLIYIVDGSILGSDSREITPDDVAELTVLNGPTGAAIYGPQAAAGAIIITTKKGKRDLDSIKASSLPKNTSFDTTIPRKVNETARTSLHAYPNPTTGPITIESQEKLSELWITDFSGKLLMRCDISGQKNSYKVDLSPYPSGVYLVRCFIKDKGWQNLRVVLKG